MKQILLATTVALTLVVSSTFARCQTAVEAWVQRYHAAESNEHRPLAIAVDSSGNAIVTGSSTDTNFFDLKHWVTIAYSSSGTPLWTNRYHTPGSGNNFAREVVVDSNGNVLVTGSGGGFATIKYSNTGMPLWTNRDNGPSVFSSSDTARAIAVDGGGNVIVTGDSCRDFITRDIATIAYSNGGVPLWTNRYNGPANGDDVPLTKQSLALGPGGSVYVAAASDGDFSNQTMFDFLTVKYAVSGPMLFITRSNSSAILSWPASALNFQLQENTNFSVSNEWSPVAQPAVTNGAKISVTIPANAEWKFFRLELRQ